MWWIIKFLRNVSLRETNVFPPSVRRAYVLRPLPYVRRVYNPLRGYKAGRAYEPTTSALNPWVPFVICQQVPRANIDLIQRFFVFSISLFSVLVHTALLYPCIYFDIRP